MYSTLPRNGHGFRDDSTFRVWGQSLWITMSAQSRNVPLLCKVEASPVCVSESSPFPPFSPGIGEQVHGSAFRWPAMADFSAVGFPAEPHHRQRAERQGATRKQRYRKGGGGKITRSR